MSTYEYIDLNEYTILYFNSKKKHGGYYDGIHEDGYQTTEFRKYTKDNEICYYVNGHQYPWTSAMPVAVTDKLAELETYDVVLQKIMEGSGLVEIRKYKEGQYGGKNKIKSEFIEWDSEYPKTLDDVLTKEEVEQKIAWVPFQLAQQKIEMERKEEEKRRQREYLARQDAEMKARRKLEEERDAEIKRMVEEFPQFPHIEEYLRKTINEEVVMKENATISGLEAKVSNLKNVVTLSQREIAELKNTNLYLVRENERLLRDNEALIKKNTWSIPGFKKRNQQVQVEHLLVQLKQSSDVSFVCQ
jgi:FtsZ-binding cell division protein ZapB